MADMKIEDADEISSVDGTEEFPIAQGNPPAAKKITLCDIKEYVISAIAQLESAATPSSTDQVVISEGGDTRLYTLDELAQKIASIISEGEEAVEFGSNDTLIVNTEDGAKPISLVTLAGAIKDNFVSEGYSFNINIAGLTAADDVDATDRIPAAQTRSGTTANKKVTVDQIVSKSVSLFPSKAATDSNAVSSTDYLLTVKDGAVKKVLLSASGIRANGAGAPQSTTADKIPQWSDNLGTLKDGLSKQTSVRAEGTADDSNIPTEKAVRTAIDASRSGMTTHPLSVTADKIPQWDGTTGALKDGLSKVTEIRGIGDHNGITTEQAVRNAITEKVVELTGKIADRIQLYTSTVTSLSDLPQSGYNFGIILVFRFGGNYGMAINIGSLATSSWKFIATLQDSLPTD